MNKKSRNQENRHKIKVQTIKKGYKQTDIGLIPEDWEVNKIGNLTTSYAGGTPSTKEPNYWGGDIKWMNSGELNNKFIFDVKNRVTVEGVNNSSTKIIPEKCVLIGLAGQGKTRGTAAINYTKLCTNQSIASIFPSNNHNSEFLYYYIDNLYDELRSLSTGDGGRGGLNLTIIRNLNIPIPTIEEQKAIAQVLSDTDQLIQNLKTLIAKKKAIKQGAMQELLTGKKRLQGFTEEWETKKLHKSFKNITTGKLDANAMSENGKYRFYTCAKEHFKIDKYAFDTEALLISGNGANVGYIHYYNGKFNAYQRTYILNEFDDDIFFIKKILENFLKDRIDKEVSAGSTPFIKKDTITDMEIIIPKSIQEQQAIAQILSDMDAEIEALEQQLQKTQALKQGMMQELLTGKTRLVKPATQEEPKPLAMVAEPQKKYN